METTRLEDLSLKVAWCLRLNVRQLLGNGYILELPTTAYHVPEGIFKHYLSQGLPAARIPFVVSLVFPFVYHHVSSLGWS